MPVANHILRGLVASTLPPAANVVTAIVMGQSEMDYLFNAGSFYRQLPNPVLPAPSNLTVWTQVGVGAAPVKTVVTPATIASGLVNPAVGALAAFLMHVRPTHQFCLGDGAVPGTSRSDLVDDTTDGADGRLWADFANVVTAIEADTAQPVRNLIECWYNADASLINNFVTNFWPIYFGSTGAGANFTLGTLHNTRQIDHCLYDAQVAPSSKGRGLFARANTKWHVLTPMPFHDAPVNPAAEMLNFSENNARLTEPARASMDGLTANTIAQSVNVQVGPSAHLCKFGGGSTEIHPDILNADGQVLLMWPIAVSLLRASGMTVGEPTIVGVEEPDDGTYADLVVSLPNGGNLTTLAALRGTTYSGAAPHQQPVTGVELNRAGVGRRPVYKTSEVGYPQAFRGTVTVVDAGSGTPRRGRVRITPQTPFAFGDTLSYLRGQATASLLEPRDFNLYPWFLLEHIPAWYNPTATYPFEGIAVKPLQSDLAINVPPPAFVARGAFFDGTDAYAATSGVSVVGTNQGAFSLWFKNSDATWNAVAGRRIFTIRTGSTETLTFNVTSSGRLAMRLNNNTATDSVNLWAALPTTPMVIGTWYNVQASWNPTNGLVVYVNDVQVLTLAYSTLDMNGLTITQFGLGANSTGINQFLGDLAHVWISTSQYIDFAQTANRRLFVDANGDPVNLGGNGQLPTGTAPEWYYDGAAPAWQNQGTAGNVTLTGALTASSTIPSY